MNIHLHQNARTTPATRLELPAQPATVTNRELAAAYGLNRHTVAKWRQREGTTDASHRPQRLQTTLSAVQEARWWPCGRVSYCPWMTCWR